MQATNRPRRAHRTSRRRLGLTLAAALLASTLALVVGAPTPAAADAPATTGSPCAPGVGVTVVVDFQQLGQGIHLGCAPGQQADGFTALTNAGFTFNEGGGPVAGTMCQIRSQPAAGYPSCWYAGFWGYWKSDGAQPWQWSDVGASSGPLAVDRVEGWSWTSPVPEDYRGTPMRIAVDELDDLLASPADCSKTVQLPTFDIVDDDEDLPVTLGDGDHATRVKVLSPATADPAGVAWTTTDVVDLAGLSGKVRILASRAGDECPGAPTFDSTYDVRGAYAPRWNATAGTAGGPSPAVDKADARIKGWITGHSSYVAGGNVSASFQTPANAYGPVDSSLVVLGDRGSYTATFGAPITDGGGYDFAAFENGFSSGATDFLEVAYVEVSSNGTDFVRFDSASRRATPVSSFGTQSPAELGGLAGKDLANKGTPFDLALLRNRPEVRSGQVDLSSITHVRLVDVQGDGNDEDSFGRAIYDPNPLTGSAGFDLTGIAVLNQRDTVAPVVTVSGAPTGTTNATSASIGYTVDDPTATVHRKLDDGAWLPATSPIELTGLAPGAHTLAVRAIDAAGNVGSASASWTVSSVTLTSDSPDAVTGQPITFTATTTSTSRGSVSFFDGSTLLGKASVANGAASITTTKLVPGTHSITASFLASKAPAADVSPALVQQVDRGETTTVLSSDPTSTVFGQATKLTATISASAPATGVISGSVAFYDDGELIGTSNVSRGVASLTVSRAVGTHPITAVYGGTSTWVGSAAAPLDHEVSNAETTTVVTSNADPAVAGQAVSLKVKVTTDAPSKAKPNGTIDLYLGSELVASKPAATGSATFSVKPAVGSMTYTAVYQGTDGVTGSAATIDQETVRASSTVTLSASATRITATVAAVKPGAGRPSGEVKVYDDGELVATVPLTSGKGTLALASLGAGPHSLTATYAGDLLFTGSATTEPLVIS